MSINMIHGAPMNSIEAVLGTMRCKSDMRKLREEIPRQNELIQVTDENDSFIDALAETAIINNIPVNKLLSAYGLGK